MRPISIWFRATRREGRTSAGRPTTRASSLVQEGHHLAAQKQTSGKSFASVEALNAASTHAAVAECGGERMPESFELGSQELRHMVLDHWVDCS